MSAYVNLSDVSDVFTPTDLTAYKRSIVITLNLENGLFFRPAGC